MTQNVLKWDKKEFENENSRLAWVDMMCSGNEFEGHFTCSEYIWL